MLSGYLSSYSISKAQWVNSLWLVMSYGYRSWLTLVQVMAWPLFSTDPLHEPILNYYQRHPWEQWNLNEITTILSQESAFQNVVCNVPTILFRSQCVHKICLPCTTPSCKYVELWKNKNENARIMQTHRWENMNWNKYMYQWLSKSIEDRNRTPKYRLRLSIIKIYVLLEYYPSIFPCLCLYSL